MVAAFPASAVAQEVPAPPRDPVNARNDLYMPSPTRAQSGVATGFYRDYGRSISAVELTKGVRIGELATAPAAPPAASRRAGLDGVASAGSPRPLLVVAALALLALLAISLAAPTAAKAKLPDGFLGVATEDVYTGDEAYATAQLAAQRRAGVTLLRQEFRWAEIEPVDGRYDFSAIDRFVGRAAAAGIRVMPLLKGEPAWATSRPQGNKSRAQFPPRQVNTYARFAAVIAKRYGPRGDFWKLQPQLPRKPITSYQLWNEPNLGVYWGDRKRNAVAYARLVIAASVAIRVVHKQAYIVSAGIPDSRLAQPPPSFIKQMLKAGAGKHLNAIAIHPYALKPSQVMAATRRMRRIVNSGRGGRRLALWVTEIGWAAGGPRSPQRSVARHAQGGRIVTTYRQLTRARKQLKLRGIVYFAWRDSEIYAGGKDFWGLHTGLIDRQGRPKPALRVVTRGWPRLR